MKESDEVKIPMMKCGCAGMATCSRKGGVVYDPPIPACAVHHCIEIDPNPPDLTGRKARCAYYGSRTRKNECNVCRKVCQCERDSDPSKLAFFVHKPNKPHDEFYCGCHSWD